LLEFREESRLKKLDSRELFLKKPEKYSMNYTVIMKDIDEEGWILR